MWSDLLRLVIFSLIYQTKYWQEFLEKELVIDDQLIHEVVDAYLSEKKLSEQEVFNEMQTFDKQKVKSLMLIFADREEELKEVIETQTKNWQKTYTILKALLFTFTLEKYYYEKEGIEFLENDEENAEASGKKKFLRRYLNICDRYLDNNSVATLHAILAKLI
jgi:hypothetical protein